MEGSKSIFGEPFYQFYNPDLYCFTVMSTVVSSRHPPVLWLNVNSSSIGDSFIGTSFIDPQFRGRWFYRHQARIAFMMGSPDTEKDRGGNEGPIHSVTISKDFYMGKYEVTQGQWESIMEEPNSWPKLIRVFL